MFKGRISLSGTLYSAKKYLESLGFIVIGMGNVIVRDEYDRSTKVEFAVICSDETLEAVDPLFGTKLWSLDTDDDS